MPLFLKSFTKNCPHLRINIKEIITNETIINLKTGVLNIGLLATPLNEPLLSEYPLFYEEFFAYASHAEKLPNKKYILPNDINLDHLWLLEEEHCLQNHGFNLCELLKQEQEAEDCTMKREVSKRLSILSTAAKALPYFLNWHY
ncbi:MAG: LysR substrate-binding domain-containing protein [Chitinophagales bacterium]